MKTIRTEKTDGIVFNDPLFSGPGDFFCINNYLAVEKTISEKHRVSISYNWDYYRLNGDRSVLQANHKLGVSYILNL